MADLLGRASRHNSTPQRKSFLVEALILLTALMTSVTVFMSLFAAAENMGNQSVELDKAVMLATSTAERFSANPTSTDLLREEDGLTIVCEVSPEKLSGGTLYRADIKVLREDKEIYRLTTSRYLSEVS